MQQPFEVGGIFHFREHDGEFIPPHARHRVRIPQAALNPPRGFNEQQVTLVVPQGVIDFLEMVQVHEKHRQLLTIALAAFDFLFQSVSQHAPIGQASECIEHGLVAGRQLQTPCAQ